MFGVSLFDRVLRAVKNWEPEKDYSEERGYRGDLLDFLREELNEPELFAFGPSQRRIKVSPESGKHLCDIGVGDEVGIELKKDLRSLKQVDQLTGQLNKFLGEYPNLIVVLVGEVADNAYEKLGAKIKDLTEETGIPISLAQGPRIDVIDKSFEELEEKKPR